MNYLAHTLLSKNNIDFQIANLVADTLKSRAWPGCSNHHRDALEMHKAIDIFTDISPHVKYAKDHLGNGYLKGVIMDIVFDHYIAKHWSRFVTVDFEWFIADFYKQAAQNLDTIPEVARAFLNKVIRYDFFHLYGEVEQLQYVFEKFNRRLSDNILAKESATDYYPRIIEHYEAIEQNFLLFFPTVITMFLDKSGAHFDEHYFIPLASR